MTTATGRSPETGRPPSQEQNQRAADAAYGRDPGHLYRVALPDVADVTLPARDPDEAKAKFNKLCGVLRTSATHTVQLIEKRPLPAPPEPPPRQLDGDAEVERLMRQLQGK